MDIELVSTEDLVFELKKRYSAGVFMGAKFDGTFGPKEATYNDLYWGDFVVIYGLLEFLRRKIEVDLGESVKVDLEEEALRSEEDDDEDPGF